jgi:hypothetical protein
MATPLLGLALPTTGSLTGTWGTTVNNSITSLLDSAVAGTTTLSTDGDVTLTTTQEAANQAREAIILWTASGTVTRYITAPAQSKVYIVINASGTQSIVLRGTGPTTGVTIVAGEKCVAAWNGTDFVKISTSTTVGTVTSASVVTANGFAGTVATATTTPAITVTTSVTGVLKGNGTAISAATAGTDYVAAGTATTFTAAQTFSGSSSVLSSVFTNMAEVATVSATAATGTINYDITTQSVLYYTSNASANWTVNFRASSGTSLNTAMATGQAVTVAFLVTQGSTAYYNSAVQVDGSSVTPKWQGGTAPSAGNASSVDVYSYTIVKTGSAAFAVFASQTKFA